MNNKKFDDLSTSTKTIMVHTNINFDFKILFNELNITNIEVPLTKKKKLPDMKKIKAPHNTIISLRHGNNFRGIKTNAKTNSQNYFLNQLSCILSLGDKLLHIMIFKDKLKIAGSKEDDHSIKAIELLWGHISKIKDSYKLIDNNKPTFIFDVVMNNVDFKLGFEIDRIKLNNLLNNEKYKDMIYMSRFETTGNTNVNIKMFSNKPEKHLYTRLILNDTPVIDKVTENIYDSNKKNKNKYTTFLVFRSSKVIESGRFYNSMKDSYNFFINIINENKNLIKEQN